MISSLRNIHNGKVFAILGSGPTLGLWRGKEDISIACNAASLHETPYHYFICSDYRSLRLFWYYSSKKHNAIRIIHSNLAIEDHILYPENYIRKDLINQRNFFISQSKSYRNERIEGCYIPSTNPFEPHMWFLKYFLLMQEIPNFNCKKYIFGNHLFKGGSVSALGIQLAYLMGGREIHIYGCSQDNEDLFNNYFKNKSSGITGQNEKIGFALLLNSLVEENVKITIHGYIKIKDMLDKKVKIIE